MNWHLLDYGSYSGKYNMDFDLQLVNSCKTDNAYLRFYGWKPYCISLGANQSIKEIDINKTKRDNIDIVKRPTGGRAILHAEELTYSVVISNYNSISGRVLYNKISQAIVNGLQLYSSNLKQVILENVQPNFTSELKKPSSGLCFASTAKSEIKFNNKKLVGSAQRKIGNIILQHGSILIGKFHTGLVNYLDIDEKRIINLQDELGNKTIELETILNEKVSLIKLQKSIAKGFEKTFDIIFSKELHPTL